MSEFASVTGRVALFLVGFILVQAIIRSAARTVVVPRGESVALTRFVFLFLRGVYKPLASMKSTAERRHAVLARYAPMSTIILAMVWATGIILAFVPMYWSISDLTVVDAFEVSGSSFTTLGFVGTPNGPALGLAVVEAILGLGVVALLIAYLPTIYGHFTRREEMVVKFEVRAGSPPLPVTYLERLHRIGWTDRLGSIWADWESWFEQLEENHTSQPSLAHFRSQRSTNSWITTAGAVLDTAAISESGLDLPHEPQTAITIRAGFLSLQSIAVYYAAPITIDPRPNEPISVTRAEFDAVLDELAGEGIPVKVDREQAWRDFAGWRVNYDMALLALCELCQAPAAAWSSDRSAGRFDVPSFWHPHRWRVHEPLMVPSW